MRIFATGDLKRIEELKLKLPVENNSVTNDADQFSYDVIIDTNADEKSSSLGQYAAFENKLLIVCAVKKSLSQMITETQQKTNYNIAGMNLLPSFINRSTLEISFIDEKSRLAFVDFSKKLNLNFLEVEDKVGMVTPRVISMVINEACYSLQEGIATMDDIEKAMKLGTNYPYGPFEWCDRIGVTNVYETLEALHEQTRDQRYEICKLLEVKYLKRESFYL